MLAPLRRRNFRLHYPSRTQTSATIALIEAGRAALARGAWQEARASFERASATEESVDALVGLGIAARYELDAVTALDAHERAFRLARALGDDDAAALVAVQLSYDAYSFHSAAEAVGWAERAAMLVDGRPPTAATAFVPFIHAYLALLGRHDPEAARKGSVEAGELARLSGAIDLQMLALALEGLSLVSIGRVDEGMRKLDTAAAAAVGGEMTDADSIESVCCFVIDACKRVRDLERASEWCLRVREIATRFGDRQMFAVCRTHYADVLLWHGDWAEAEFELVTGARELGRLRPGRDEDALVRLAELRRRQGRTTEAAELLDRSTTHRLHPLVTGLLAFDRGDVETARAAADRFLRRIGETDRFERVVGLELLVRAAVAAGDKPWARAAADEIAAIAHATPNGPLRATALLAEGRLAAAATEHALARALLEDAADLFDASGARYDAALARLELAAALRAEGRDKHATRVGQSARDTLLALGARTVEEHAGDLSLREQEVLRLVAHGDSNDEIARRLVLSVRTVERHVANVYAKLGLSGRTARAAATAWAHTHGIA